MADPTTEHTSFFARFSFLGTMALVALGGVFYMAGKNIEANKINPQGMMTVTGDATSYATPNLGQISVGVQIDREDSASEAMAQLRQRMNEVLAAVKQAGVIDKDIRVATLSLGPSYDYTNGRQELEGYTASQMVSIKSKNLDRIGDILNAAAEAGANLAGDVQFTVENPDTVKDNVRKTAMAEAQKKAQEMATQLGVALGSLKSYTESLGGPVPGPMYARSAVGGAADASFPLPAGEQEVTMTVTLTYEIH